MDLFDLLSAFVFLGLVAVGSSCSGATRYLMVTKTKNFTYFCDCCPQRFFETGRTWNWFIGLSICLSVCHTNFNLSISSEVLIIKHWYLACMIFVTSPFNWHYAVTFDLFQGQICCHEFASLVSLYSGIFTMYTYTYSIKMLDRVISRIDVATLRCFSHIIT